MIKCTLFFGNFFLGKSGTKSISQKLIDNLDSENGNYLIGSNSKNKFLRVFEIIYKTFFYNYQNIHVDVFSDKAFNIAILVVCLNKIKKKKLILNLRGGRLQEFYLKNKLNKIKFQFIFRNADHIISPSKFLSTFFNSVGHDVKYFPNYINLEHFPYKGDLVINNKLLWVRAFHEIYNPKDAVFTLSHLIEKIPDATLTMIGPDKGELKEVIQLIDELHLTSNISILGPIKNEELYQYFHSHSVLINTTSYESFGQSLLEAASCGCPIVSNSVGEIPLLWKDNKDIMLSRLNDPRDMAKKIYFLMSNHSLIKKIIKNAHEKSGDYEWSNMKKSWATLLT